MSVGSTIPLVIGATYTERATDAQYLLAGLRSKGRVCLVPDHTGTERPSIDWLPVAEFADRFEHTACNHEGYCCDLHGTHSSPHNGCPFR